MRTVQQYRALEKPLSVFISYAHRDKELRDQLERSLKIFERLGMIRLWYDGAIGPGEEWEAAIRQNLEEADIILLLISPDFISSDFCWKLEMHRAMERYETGDAVVVPILLRPVAAWEKAPFSILQILPDDGRAVIEWESLDEGLVQIARGIEALLIKRTQGQMASPPQRVHWLLRFESNVDQFSVEHVELLTCKLRKLTHDWSINCIEIREGSVELTYRSSDKAFTTLQKWAEDGSLQEKLGEDIIDLSKLLGAYIRIESREVTPDEAIDFTSLNHIFAEEPSQLPFPPIVGGMMFPINNPMQIGYNVYVDANHPQPSGDALLSLQKRLGHYMTTFVVVEGHHIHVDLSPFEPYCGLPEPLRHTELGRDLLAEDLQLKLYTSRLLHPAIDSGKAFWDALESLPTLPKNLETCVRAWIVPDGATIEEKTIEDKGQVILNEMRLNVLCEIDYNTLNKLHGRDIGQQNQAESADNAVIDAFKRHILPHLQHAVSFGPGFGVLRQIYSVLVMAKWFREKYGSYLKEFMDSNDTARYNLNVVGDEPLQIQQEYLQVFKEGLWRWVRPTYDYDSYSGRVMKKVYIVGGIRLN